MIARHLAEELPFMASENLLMAAVAAGGDRQQLHEMIRRHSQAAGAVVKQEGTAERFASSGWPADPAFAKVDVAAALDPASFVGRAARASRRILAIGRRSRSSPRYPRRPPPASCGCRDRRREDQRPEAKRRRSEPGRPGGSGRSLRLESCSSGLWSLASSLLRTHMPAIFDKLGIQFLYPENWTLDEQEAMDGRARRDGLQSRGGVLVGDAASAVDRSARI